VQKRRILAGCPTAQEPDWSAFSAALEIDFPMHNTPTTRLDTIRIRGARTHNLKNIDVDIPRDKLVVITGLSGSGKSSLAFDTIYADGQRRYVESLSAYARQFLSLMEKPDVDHIDGLSPAISIEQKSTSHNPRSTVGTVTEIYDYLRLLYARVGTPCCPEHGLALEAQTVSEMVDRVLALPEDSKLMLLAPVVQERKGEYIKLLDEMRAQGFVRARIDGEIYELDQPPELEPKKKHTIEIVVDRFKVRSDLKQRLAESFDTTLGLTNGIARIAGLDGNGPDTTFSARMACTECGYSLAELEPKLFSFNNPSGACSSCDGLGVQEYFDIERVVSQPSLSMAAGAVRGWDKRNPWSYSLLKSLAKYDDFSLETPYCELSEKIQKRILWGTGKQEIPLTYTNEKGSKFVRDRPFEGIINNLDRRYRETESNAVRDEFSKLINSRKCTSCDGARLNAAARNVFVAKRDLPSLTALSISDAHKFFSALTLPGKKGQIAERILKEINERLGFLVNVGLEYLSLSRSAETLSGGEAQRIRLASQIGAGLVGVMYVLDEPSIGLHQRDNERLLETLIHLRDLGNTVIVVEHDEEAIRAADHVLDIGPGAGKHGGTIVAQGDVHDIIANKNSCTGQYLSGVKKIAASPDRSKVEVKGYLRIVGATGNNLKNVTVEIPQGLITCVTGVSGSGKSTLINGTLYPVAANVLNGAERKFAPHTRIENLDLFDKVIDIDQSAIGRTPRSNPATYTGLFTPIRELFAATPEARARGYKPGRFSFNVKGGRCEACQGDGLIKVEMHFLPDVYVPCDSCKGKRYNRETLSVHYKGKSIHEVLQMTVEEALPFFGAVPNLAKKLQTLFDVGLTYVTLGQSATTLSGGEAQRVKLAKELSKRDTGKTLYILDEPTTGLHFADIAQLLGVLERLREHGNTIVIIEHNLDVVKTADWVIDLGPEGGDGGGTLVAAGTPAEIAKEKASHTGRFLKQIL
jgi:excinuclease ABC subunit A